MSNFKSEFVLYLSNDRIQHIRTNMQCRLLRHGTQQSQPLAWCALTTPDCAQENTQRPMRAPAQLFSRKPGGCIVGQQEGFRMLQHQGQRRLFTQMKGKRLCQSKEPYLFRQRNRHSRQAGR